MQRSGITNFNNHLIHDIFEAKEPRFRNTQLGYEDDDVTLRELLGNRMAIILDVRTDVRLAYFNTYSAFTIEASKGGLLDCGFKLPSIPQSSLVFVRPTNSADLGQFLDGSRHGRTTPSFLPQLPRLERSKISTVTESSRRTLFLW